MQRNEKLMKRSAEMQAFLSDSARVFLKPDFDFIDPALVTGDS
jgi:hypothetical protein